MSTATSAAAGLEAEVDMTSEAARIITRDWMALLGYAPEEIDAAEPEPDHSICDMTDGGWECGDEDGIDRHPVHHEMNQVAHVVMFVLEHPALAYNDAPAGSSRRVDWGIRVNLPHPTRKEKAGAIIKLGPGPGDEIKAHWGHKLWHGWSPVRQTTTRRLDGYVITSPWMDVPVRAVDDENGVRWTEASA